ncbi:MAG: hypothetical protein JWO59_2796 [Chloroflexi bacterium]|nr:hypothetical protein [Chloroflexota bacterium]
MARYEPIPDWPGSVMYRAAHGRIYCAAPRGLIPAYPYSMAALRPPTSEESRNWGPGVLPRMVVDVTNVRELARMIREQTMQVAPWNAYLVLRLPDSRVIVAYGTSGELPRLDKRSAAQVAIASGHDVDGWSSEMIRRFQGEHWQFTPPRYEPVLGPLPAIVMSER